jgi:hypothetical protein
MLRIQRLPLASVGWTSVMILGLLLAPPAHASAELRTVLAEVAADLKKLLDGQNDDALAIGQFTGPPNLPTSAGPGIVQILSEELQKKGIQVKTRAKLGVRGRYHLAELPAEHPDDARLGVKVLAVEIEVNVEDAFGKPLGDLSFKRKIRGEATVLDMVGVPASLPPQGTERERDQELRHQLIEPKPEIRGTVIRSKAGSPYGIEILVNKRARPAETKDDLPFVRIQQKEIYAVRVINETDSEVAVQLHIDGLSMFAFSQLRQPPTLAGGRDNPSKGEPLYTAMIVPPRKGNRPGTEILEGWHRNNNKGGLDSFLVTEYAKGAAATLNHTTNIGTITATFQAAWPEGQSPPVDEPGKRRGGTGDATGFGPPTGDGLQEVKRNLGVIRDSISVRYTKTK